MRRVLCRQPPRDGGGDDDESKDEDMPELVDSDPLYGAKLEQSIPGGDLSRTVFGALQPAVGQPQDGATKTTTTTTTQHKMGHRLY